MMECSENTVKIPDVSPAVFMSMLQWMATDTLNIDSICNLNELIKVADKYQMDGLLSSCCRFLQCHTLTIHVVMDSILCKYHGVDLGLQHLKEMSARLRVLSYSSIHDVVRAIAKQLNWDSEHVQLWRVSNRKNGTTRPNRYLSPMMDQDQDQEPMVSPTMSRMRRESSQKQKQEGNESEDDENEHHDENAENENEREDLDEDGDDEMKTMNLKNCWRSMKCHECHQQSFNKKRGKSNKKMDWIQYSGDSPSKAIYARLCSPKSLKCSKSSSSPKAPSGKSPQSESTELSQSLAFSSFSQKSMEIEAEDEHKEMNHNKAASATSKNYENKILLFLKYYDVYHEYLSIVGSVLVEKHGPIESICTAIRQIAHWSDEHEVVLWEEEDHKTNKINPIDTLQTIAEASLVDGDIIVFQEKSNIFNNLQLHDAKTFLASYSNHGHHQRMERMDRERIESNHSNHSNHHRMRSSNAMNSAPAHSNNVDDQYRL